jgi:hypothetical protein
MSAKTSDHFNSYEQRADLPAVGSTWVWEPLKAHARENVTVTEVKWNGEEWWVETESRKGKYWNDLSRFWGACVPEPDPNRIKVGDTIHWNGRPSFARGLPSGWTPKLDATRWSKVGDDLWQRIA